MKKDLQETAVEREKASATVGSRSIISSSVTLALRALTCSSTQTEKGSPTTVYKMFTTYYKKIKMGNGKTKVAFFHSKKARN